MLSEGILGIGPLADTNRFNKPPNPTLPDLTDQGNKHEERGPTLLDLTESGPMEGLLPPSLASGESVTGASSEKLRKANKTLRQRLQQDQPRDLTW